MKRLITVVMLVVSALCGVGCERADVSEPSDQADRRRLRRRRTRPARAPCHRRSFRTTLASRSSSTTVPARAVRWAPSLRRSRAPDGYTLLLTTTAIYAILPNLRKNLPYDPVRDFVPITRIATASNVLVVNNELPAKNIAELVKLAKEKPGALNYASAGVGTPAHLAGEMLNLLADIKVVARPVQRCGAGAGGRHRRQRAVHHYLAHRRGRTHERRPRARAGDHRRPSATRACPTCRRSPRRFPATRSRRRGASWSPAGTPPEIVNKLSAEIVKVMNQPDVKEKVLATGATPVGDSPAEFEAFMAKERQRLGDVIAKRGIVLTD